MKIRNMNVILMLVAGIIVAIFSILSNYSIEKTVYTMLIVFVVFLLLGTILQGLLNRIIAKNAAQAEEAALKAAQEAVEAENQAEIESVAEAGSETMKVKDSKPKKTRPSRGDKRKKSPRPKE